MAASAVAAGLVLGGRSGWAAVLAWGAGIALWLVPWLEEWRRGWREWRLSWRGGALLLAALVTVGMRWGLSNPARVHGDELITAYFSATEDLSPRRFYFHVPESRVEWVSQFPTTFFLLQRLGLTVFGDDIAGVRLSVLPWVFLATVFLFFAVRALLDEPTAWLAVALSCFLAFSLYLETLALHFVSSTAVFLAFVAAGARAFRHRSPADAALAGVLCGACYLFYTSSYLALPLLLAVAAWRAVRVGLRETAPLLGVALGGVAVVLAPFAAGAAQYNYFASRWAQVSLLSGSWSDVPERVQAGASLTGILAHQLWLSLRSLAQPGLGGHGGYFFGLQALFEPFSLGLLLLGVGLAVLRHRSHPGGLVVLGVTAAAFVSGVVLTVPPPAFHRASLALPLFATLMALPLRELLRLPWLSPRARAGLVVAGVTLFASLNLGHFYRGSANETAPEELHLGACLNSRFPAKKMYVAAFPGYAFAKLAYFSGVRRTQPVVTTYHADLLEAFPKGEDYLLIIAMPDIFTEQFARLDPGAKVVALSPRYTLMFN